MGGAGDAFPISETIRQVICGAFHAVLGGKSDGHRYRR